MKLEVGVKEKLLPVFDTAKIEPDFGNGRYARNLLEKAQMRQASRIVRMEAADVTQEEMRVIKVEDFELKTTVNKAKKRNIGF